MIILIVPKYWHLVLEPPGVDGDFIFYLGIPLLLILFLFQEKTGRYGLGLGLIKKGFFFILSFGILYIPFFLILAKSQTFTDFYGSTSKGLSGQGILIIHVLPVLLQVLNDEFFFRGFLLFGLKDKWGDANAIFIQMVPYALMHIGKPGLECFGSIPVGVVLGYMAVKTRSIWYGWFLHGFYAAYLQWAVLNSSF